MHMRKKKWSRPELAACPYYFPEAEAQRGHWTSCFAHPEQPLELELGCGKGVSTAQMVHAFPEVNFIAIDISPDVLGCARRNIEEAYQGEPVRNVALTRCDIEHIGRFFAPEDPVRCIYIHFCNPWTARPRQHRRRLTHPRQLMQYRTFLADGGEIRFKTDDEQLFRESLQYFAVCGFEMIYRTDDLHQSGYTPNFQSEHELKFSAAGMPIHFAIFRKLPGEVILSEEQRRLWHMQEKDETEENEA